MDKYFVKPWWCERNTTRGQVMKFVMIILFATAGDIYMFTDPTFDSKNECMSFLMNNGLITQRENNTGIRLSKTDRIQSTA